MATVFDVFKEVPYTYLVISQGRLRGDTIVSESDFLGVFKDKSGMVQSGNMESYQATARLHVHPNDFPNVKSCMDLTGNGVRVNGVEYMIEGATAGTNFDTGVIEHYTLNLQKAEFVNE